MINKINLSPAVRHYQQKAVSFKQEPAQTRDLEEMDAEELRDLVFKLKKEINKLEAQKSELIGLLGYDPFQFAK